MSNKCEGDKIYFHDTRCWILEADVCTREKEMSLKLLKLGELWDGCKAL